MVSGLGGSLGKALGNSLEKASTTKILFLMAAAGMGRLLASNLSPQVRLATRQLDYSYSQSQSQAYMAAGSAALQSMTQSTDYTMGLFSAQANSLMNAGHMIPGTFNGGMGGSMFGFDPMMGMGGMGMGMGPGMMNQNGMQGGIQIPPPTPGVAELVQQLQQQQQQRQIQQLQQQIQQQSEEHPKNDPEPEIVRGKSNEQLRAFIERLIELSNKQDNKNAEKADRHKEQAKEVRNRTVQDGAPVRGAEGGNNAAKGAGAPAIQRTTSARLQD